MSQSVDRHQRGRALFEELRELPRAAQPAALAAACAGDARLEEDVAQLLAAAADAGSFLERGAEAALAAGSSLIGRRLGPYEIQGILGAGGMGEVYRARDAALGRDVALKILPELFAVDPDRVARFRREAQILASLNHPHIAAIYGLEESNGVPVLVLELVDGPTLADRIAGGKVPLDDALPIALQMVEALEAAHAQGIVHRDLKPANLKLRADGTVKVLDFGLAKALETPAVDVNASQSPTYASPSLTRMGAILGTAAYMSPEQAKGRPVDKRSDIWSFGCVLFEMLSGTPAFGGQDNAESLAFILTREPDWGSLPPGTPASIRRLLRRCLEKDRARRLADIADARLELDERGPEDATAEAATPRPSGTLRWLPWAIAAVCLATALGLGGLRVWDRPAASDAPVFRSSIPLPGRLGTVRSSIGAYVALSPDGRRLAFVAADTNGRTQLWLRSLDELVAQPLADTADALSPFWSPDSRWMAFVQNGALKKVDASGGRPVTLSEPATSGGTWSRDNVILFTQRSGRLAQVPAGGGVTSPLTTIEGNGGEVFNFSPVFLPDGRRFIYASIGKGEVRTELYLASLDAAFARKRLPLDATVQYAAGRLWFLRGSTLMAQPFDPVLGALSAEAVPIAEHVRIDNTWTRTGVFTVSPTGTLVFQADPSPGYELVWYDREGRRLGTLGTPADYADVQLSPDGRRVLVSVAPVGSEARDIWMFDVGRGLRTRFTFDDARPLRGPIWSRDGRRVVFASAREGRVVFLQKSASGAGDPEVLIDDDSDKEPLSWSPDGRSILFLRRDTVFKSKSWVLPLDGDRKPYALPQPRALFASFSPDGRWISYFSAESGRVEVYVAPFPGPGGRWQISTAGGLDPRFRADGKEIFYLSPFDNKIMAAPVNMGRDHVDVGEAQPLFTLPKVGPRITYDVSGDGQRILAVTQREQAASAPLTLVVNWPALLKQ